MNEPSSNDLLGFMLGALETDEHQEIESLLEHDPETREELDQLRGDVAVLDHLSPPGMPPAGLARRTCERISALASSQSDDDDNLPAPGGSAKKSSRRWFSSGREYAGNRRSSLMDFVIVAVVVMLLAAIVLPAINNSRFHSRVLSCKNNLRTVGMGLLDYSSNFGGKYIEIPKEGNLAFAGLYAPTLVDSGYVDDPGAFLCAGTGATSIEEEKPRFPTLNDLRNAKGRVLRGLQKLAGGDYAYSLGQFVDGRYEAGRNEHRSHFLILADAPSVDQPRRRSGNHSGYGQNGFFEDGHIQFLADPVVADDAIYENNWGNIAPGADPDDIVVAPSAVSLYIKHD